MMKFLVSGASGLIGTELVNFLKISGHQVKRLIRKDTDLQEDEIFWSPEEEKLDRSSLEGFDVVINLAGDNLSTGRWNAEKKKRILNSRLKSTETLVNALCQLKRPPSCLLSASAIGIYGETGRTCCNEQTPRGTGFLAEVCQRWEAATEPAVKKGIRVVNLRFGVVLSAHGGALAKMLPLFKMGFGGKLGSGEQYMSWVAIDDLVAIIMYAVTHPSLKGPVNVVSPYAVTNAAFTRILAKVLNRSAFLSVPAFALRLLLGKEMANELLLTSTRVEPLKLTHAAYSFMYSDLEVALRHLLT